MSAYYNEFDPYAAQWLRNLIKAGVIADGVVDERSITEVDADDLTEFTQCHFFAGLGGWSHALRLAGWPDDRPVWTGSPPCQPFSVAGQQKGKQDERHLAPVWLNLVSKCRPTDLFGEQVAAAVTKDEWLDDLQNHLEAEGYATGASVLPACSVGAPHIRQRIVFCAKRVAHPCSTRFQEQRGERDEPKGLTEADVARGMADTKHARPHGDEGRRCATQAGQRCEEGEDYTGELEGGGTTAMPGDLHRRKRADGICRTSPTNEFWQDADWLYCRDGKWRPVESSTFPLADGVSGRVGRLRAYGNAIVPQVAAEYIMAYQETMRELGL